VSYLAMRGRSVLYINHGDGTFSDRTKQFGLGGERLIVVARNDDKLKILRPLRLGVQLSSPP
jgi:hypothetical protein